MALRVAPTPRRCSGSAPASARWWRASSTGLDERDDVELLRYAVSMRAPVPPGVRRFPYPARFALEAWSRGSTPSGRRTLAGRRRRPRHQLRRAAHRVADGGQRPRRLLRHQPRAGRRCGAIVRAHHPAVPSPAAPGSTPSPSTSPARSASCSTPSGCAWCTPAPPGPRSRPPPDRRCPASAGAATCWPSARGSRARTWPGSSTRSGCSTRPHTRHRTSCSPGPPDRTTRPSTPPSAALLAAGRRARARHRLARRRPARRRAGRQPRCVAYPSLDEGFGFPALEGMAAGVPVVAARAGAIPEVAGDAAVLVDPLDAGRRSPTAWPRALDDEALRAALVAGGREQLGRVHVVGDGRRDGRALPGRPEGRRGSAA